MNTSLSSTKVNFESMKEVNPHGKEFWLASELMKVLGYEKKERFIELIERAKESCKKSGHSVEDHFPAVGKMINVGKGAQRKVTDYELSRFACYLIAQNGDPRQKKQIALAQTYFAFQTRKQEMHQQHIEEMERLTARQKLTQTEREFAGVLFEKGINSKGLAMIKSAGDKALFGGKTTDEMKQQLGVKSKRPLADFLPTITIKAKDLAAEMTTFKTKEKNLTQGTQIKSTHVSHNTSVRKVLTDENIYPEKLPIEEDIKKIERRIKKEESDELKLSEKTVKQTLFPKTED